MGGCVPAGPRRAGVDHARPAASWSDKCRCRREVLLRHGTYTKTVNAPAEWFTKGAQLWIDLGNVKNLAEVK